MLIFLLITLLFTRFYALFNVGMLFYNFEGLYGGWMAKELLNGAGWRYVFNHSYMPAEGGSVIVGYMASLFFLIFGDSFFSLELVPILFSVLILTAFYLLLKRHFGIYVAIISSFLFIFSPPAFFYRSLFALDFHFESILFTIMSLFCFFEIFFNEDNYKVYVEKAASKKINLLFMSMGVVNGFGIYFDYSVVIMLFTIILSWLFIDRKFFLKRHFFVFLSGFLIGLLPWAIYNCTHNFTGLAVNGYSPSKILFHKSLVQILQTFKYISAKQLYENLRNGLYPIVFVSLIFVTFFNLYSLRSSKIKCSSVIKELIFISYILIFIFTWSTLYLPSGESNGPLWMSGLDGRLVHVYPFLFVLVALCFNRFLPFKKDKNYFMKMAFSLIFAILILRIGFLNYSHIINEPRKKIQPLDIKGYSARVACQRGLISRGTVFEQDILNACRIAERDNDAMFWDLFIFNKTYYSLYDDSSEGLQKIMKGTQYGDEKKPYYYLLIGLNTGDMVKGYDILILNKLINQKIPEEYRHYVYEGIAISLMNRRRDEIMANREFIEKVPAEYRHYFLLQLDRVTGACYYGADPSLHN
jgi:4-amino-4-deoxy-L-arabinose transferase-like glycosyltransferase